VKLSKKGITIDAQSPIEIDRLKKAGYVEPEEIPVPETKEPEKVEGEPSTNPTIEQIYAMCDEAGVKPEDLKINGENPTLTQVKAAITKAKKAGGK